MVLAGRILPRVGPRRLAVAGGVLLGAGYLFGGFFGDSFWAQLLGIGIVGGALVANVLLDIPFVAFGNSLEQAVGFADVFGGVGKAVVFGLLVAAIACQRGLATRGGAEPDDPRLPSLMVSVCVDGTCKLWEVRDYRFKQLGAFDTTLPGETGVTCACLRSTHTLLLGYEHGSVQLWRLRGLNKVY